MNSRVKECCVFIIALAMIATGVSCSSFSKCAVNGDLKCMGDRIAKGEDVNKYDNDGFTPLLWAAYYGNAKSVRFLIKKGADVNLGLNKDYGYVLKDSTPLIIAATYDFTEVVDVLLKNGSNKEALNRGGKSAPMIAIENNSATMVALLGKTPGVIDKKSEEELLIKVMPGEITIPLNDGTKVIGKVISSTRKEITVKTHADTVTIDRDRIMNFVVH